jgi:uncharacterized membrane protein
MRWLLHGFFFFVFCLFGVVNHYFFRSAALDYGIANQAMYLISHGEAPFITMLLGEHQTYHYLGLHVSFWIPIFSPLYFIFGSYTLLLVQNAALIFAGIGIVNLARKFSYTKTEQLLIATHYYVFFGIYAALAVEYHDNVIGASFLPWLILFFLEDELLLAAMCALAMLISKENMAIWVIAIGPGLWLLHKPLKFKKTLFPIGLIVFATIWFLGCAYYVMPYYNPAGKFEQVNRFSHLGKSVGDVFFNVVAHPINAVELFYQSHVQPDADEIIKQEFLWAILLSGAWALVLNPAFLLMSLPLLMQKLWNKETAFWGVNYHYQIEFAALISIALLFVLKPMKGKWRVPVLVLFVLLSALTSYSLMQQRHAYLNPSKENIFDKAHYQSNLNVSKIQKRLASLPEEARITAQTNLLPHVSNRKHAFHFPYVLESNLLIMTRKEIAYYPLNAESGKAFIDSLIWKARWRVDTSNSELLLLYRPN